MPYENFDQTAAPVDQQSTKAHLAAIVEVYSPLTAAQQNGAQDMDRVNYPYTGYNSNPGAYWGGGDRYGNGRYYGNNGRDWSVDVNIGNVLNLLFNGGRSYDPYYQDPYYRYQDQYSRYQDPYYQYQDQYSRYQDPYYRYQDQYSRYQDPYYRYQDQYSRYQDPYSRYQDQYSRYQDPYYRYQDQYSRYQDPYYRYQDQYSRYQDPYYRYQDQYSRYQDPYSRYQDQYSRYQDPYSRYQDQYSRYQDPYQNRHRRHHRDDDDYRYSQNQRYYDGYQNYPQRYNNNGDWQRMSYTIRSMVGHSVREYDPRVTEEMGCAAFVSAAVSRSTGCRIDATGCDDLKRQLVQNGYRPIPVSQAQPGDPIVASRGGGRHGHAAIYVGDGKVANNSSYQHRITVDDASKFNSPEFQSVVAFTRA
jgi:hypothetical protein